MIKINLEKAKEVHKNFIRGSRNELFKELDIQFQRALETGEGIQEIVAKKQILRDYPDRPEIENASTIEELKSCWDEELLGENVYKRYDNLISDEFIPPPPFV